MLGFCPALRAQDVIIKLSGEEIRAKVEEVSDREVRYKKFSNREGPSYVIVSSEIFMIKYENGNRDLFQTDSKSGKVNIKNIQTEQKTAEKPAEKPLAKPVEKAKKPENKQPEKTPKPVNETVETPVPVISENLPAEPDTVVIEKFAAQEEENHIPEDKWTDAEKIQIESVDKIEVVQRAPFPWKLAAERTILILFALVLLLFAGKPWKWRGLVWLSGLFFYLLAAITGLIVLESFTQSDAHKQALENLGIIPSVSSVFLIAVTAFILLKNKIEYKKINMN